MVLLAHTLSVRDLQGQETHRSEYPHHTLAGNICYFCNLVPEMVLMPFTILNRLRQSIPAIVLMFALCTPMLAGAQDGDFKGLKKEADYYFSNTDYDNALRLYLKLYDMRPADPEINYKVGQAYLKSGADDTKAVPYLERVVKTGKFDNDAWYYLGKAYHHSLMLDKAIESLGKYKEGGLGKAASSEEVDKDIEYCENAREVIKYPIDVVFENLGPEVNSIYPDYFPFVPEDESFIIYNTRRNDGSMGDALGGYTSNIYISNVEDGRFSVGVPISPNINLPELSEQVVGLSADGQQMLLFFDSYGLSGDVFLTRKVGDVWDDPEALPESINSKAKEVSACFNEKADAIYFASDRKGGYGGTDLYVTRILPTGDWGPAQNLGPDINTADDEDFPNISPDGKTLYFSSKGHTAMGGFDIFRAKFDPDSNRFASPRNLGYPINTTHDDMNFRASASGRYGYIGSKRPEGFGDFDLYRVTFNNIESELTAIRGVVASADTSKALEDVQITVTDNVSGDVLGYYLPNPYTQRYIIILPPGDFNIFAETPNHDPISHDIVIHDKSSYQAEIARDLVFEPNDY